MERDLMSFVRSAGGLAEPDGGLSSGSAWKRVRFGLLLAVVFIAWGVTSWLLAEKLTFERTSRLIAREQDVASSGAASVGSNVGFTLAHMRSIPKVMARQPEIETILSRIGPEVRRSNLPLPRLRERLATDPDLDRVAKRLESILAELDIDQIWIMNTAGDCIASGGFPSESTATGVNYVDREYFQLAKREGTGRQFAVGRTTNTPGIFYSAAVIAENRFLGAVAIKIDVERLSRMVTDKNTFITDENGVVIMAGDTQLYMKAVPGAKVSKLSKSEQESRYKRHVFGTLEIKPVDDDGVHLVRLEGRDAPMLKGFSDNQANILTIWVLRDMSELGRIRNEGIWVFVLLFLAGSSAIAGAIARVAQLRRAKEHQAEIARVNAELVKLNEELLVQAVPTVGISSNSSTLS
jgi:C4-dicarboxylate-specific signal transduction histidine kinase